jgi:ElaB/YqjD/DUF883 family membrane-anchored ribosome-binding protein
MSDQAADGTSAVEEKVDQAKEVVSAQASQAAERSRGMVQGQLDQRSTQVGQQVGSASSVLRRAAEQSRLEGNDQQARVAEQIADRGDRVSAYLIDADGRQLLEEAEDFARRQPWVVAGAGALIGFALARALKASSSDRYHVRSQARYGHEHYQTVYSAQASRAEHVPGQLPADSERMPHAGNAQTIAVGAQQ